MQGKRRQKWMMPCSVTFPEGLISHPGSPRMKPQTCVFVFVD
jgi:hypothetical protein